MGWRDELRPGSFRGIALEMVDLSLSGGKRLVVDEYPEQDEHTVDELGRKARRFKVRAFVAGDNYLETRDRLLDALEREGPGELVHPWRGRVQVQAGEVEITHDGHGACLVDFDCVIAASATGPTVEVDQVEATTTNAAAATAAASVQTNAHSLDDLPTYYESQVIAALDIVQTTWGLNLLNAEVAPAEVIAALDDLRSLLRLVREYPLGSPRATLGPAPETPSEQAAVDALDVYYQELRVAALARACELAAATDYVTADAAESDLAGIVDAITDELDETDDSDLFDALVDLRASVVAAITDLADRLPRLRTLEVGVPTPAIVLAFDLYEDVEREAQLVAMNNISNPAFAVGPLSVLSE